MQPSGQRIPLYVRQGLAISGIFWSVVFIVSATPAARPAWEVSLPLHRVEPTFFVSDPITSFVTPYISFTNNRSGSAIDSNARVDILAGGEPVHLGRELSARSLIGVAASDTTAHQFAPSTTLRVAITGVSDISEITIGYDGRQPVVSVIHYWWPFLVAGCLLSFAVLILPSTWPFQLSATERLQEAFRKHRPILMLIVAAALVRLLLVLRGGQYFDWDESRYGGGAAWMFSYLSTGNFEAALGMLLKSPDHPGFRAVGLVPAFFHVASAWPTSQPITEMRVRTGEWLPAFLLSLGSVSAIGLTYALASRSGASRSESFLAAFLMFASSSMLSYARHFFPYDISMAMLLGAIWIGLDNFSRGAPTPAFARSASARPRRSLDGGGRALLAGFLVGLGFLTYEGHWALAAAAATLHMLGGPSTAAGRIRRALWFGLGAAICPGLLALAAATAGRTFVTAVERFARTAVNGDFNEGWSLPWVYLWHAEHGLLMCYVAGVASLVYLRFGANGSKRSGLRWLAVAAGIYCSLVIGANVLHRFVVYDRLARQMLPFICLAAAAGLRDVTSPRFRWPIYVTVALVAAPNWMTVFTQRFPRDVAIESVKQFGADNVGVRMTIAGVDNATVGLFLPFADPASALARPSRYVLTDAQDIWVPGGASESVARPEGKVLLSTRHPRQLKSMQYHGYQPAERRFLRSIDFPIQLIDTQPDRPTSSR